MTACRFKANDRRHHLVEPHKNTDEYQRDTNLILEGSTSSEEDHDTSVIPSQLNNQDLSVADPNDPPSGTANTQESPLRRSTRERRQTQWYVAHEVLMDNNKEILAEAHVSGPDTMYYHEAMKEYNRDELLEAMDKEITNQMDSEVIELVEKATVPSNMKVFSSVWALPLGHWCTGICVFCPVSCKISIHLYEESFCHSWLVGHSHVFSTLQVPPQLLDCLGMIQSGV